MPRIGEIRKPMKVLVACEFSGTVRNAFLAKGHDAWSCDLIHTTKPPFERHIKGDVRGLLREPWDLIIAHPPCTYLTNTGVQWMSRKGRYEKMIKGAIFFLDCLLANSPKICVENPIMHKYAFEIIGERQTQLIQPYQFGHPESKATCLWLKGLPKLKPTNIVKPVLGSRLNNTARTDRRWKIRSLTFPGIARAMAEQWG